MAKRQVEQPAGVEVSQTTENRIEEFAEDLGRLLGTARAKAEGWLGQRQQIAEHLTEIRDTAASLLQQLTGGGAAVMAATVRRGLRGRRAGTKDREQTAVQKSGPRKRRRRKMSAEARKRISEAQKKRWAKQKRNA